MRTLKFYKRGFYVILISTVTTLGIALLFFIITGFSLRPLGPLISRKTSIVAPGLTVDLKGGKAQLIGGLNFHVELEGIHLADTDNNPSLSLAGAYVELPVRRLWNKNVLPESIQIKGIEIWVETDAEGKVVLPDWLLVMLSSNKEPVVDERTVPFSLSDLPEFILPKGEERLQVKIEGFIIHISREDALLTVELPSFYLDIFEEGKNTKIAWQSLGWESESEKLVEGHAVINRLSNHIQWMTHLNLPLSSELANWLEQGFAFLALPKDFHSRVHLINRGSLQLSQLIYETEGEVVINEGFVFIEEDLINRLTIPPIAIAYRSKGRFVPDQLLIENSIECHIGKGESDTGIFIENKLDQHQDTLKIKCSGNVQSLDELIHLLPEKLNLVHLRGNALWNIDIETRYSNPLLFNKIQSFFSSEGIFCRFEDDSMHDLELSAFELAVNIGDQGNKIYVEPFALQLGPIGLSGTGVDWLKQDGKGHGEMTIQIHPFKVADCMEYIPEGMVEISSDVRVILESMEFNKAEFVIDLSSDINDTYPLGTVSLKPDWAIRLLGVEVVGRGVASVDLNTLNGSFDMLLGQFNPKQVNFLEIEKFGTLDSLITLSASGDFSVEKAALDAQLKAQLSPGEFIFGETLSSQFVGSFPIDAGTCTLRLHGEHVFSLESEFAFSSPMLNMGAHLDIASFNPYEFGVDPLVIHLDGFVRELKTDRIISLFNDALLVDLGFSAEEIEQFNMETFDGALTLKIEDLAKDALVSIEVFDADLHLLTGMEPLDFSMKLSNSSSDQLTLDWHLQPWNLGQTGLVFGERLPVPLSVFQLPIKGNGSVVVEGPLQKSVLINSLPSITAESNVFIEYGRIEKNEYLKEDLVIDLIEIHTSISPLDKRISSVNAELNLAGGEYRFAGKDILLESTPVGTISFIGKQILPGSFIKFIPDAFIPDDAKQYWEGLQVIGGIDDFVLSATLGVVPEGAKIPFFSEMTFRVEGGKFQIIQRRIPELTLDHFNFKGDLEQVQVQIESAGNSAGKLDSAFVRIQQFLSDAPKVAVEASYSSDLRALENLIDPLEMESSFPEWFQIEDLRGTIEGQIVLEGIVNKELKPEDWSFSHSMKIQDLHTAIPVDGVFYDHLDMDLTNRWKEGRLVSDFNLYPNEFNFDTLALGNPVITGQFSADLSGEIVFEAQVDLRDFETHIEGLSRNLLRGDPVWITFKSEGNTGFIEGSFPDLRTEFQANNLFLDQLGFSLHSVFNEKYSGQLGGLQSVDFVFNGMNNSDMCMKAWWNEEGVFVIDMDSKRLNFGPLLVQLEPMILGILNGEESTENQISRDESASENILLKESLEDKDALEGSMPLIPEIVFDLNIQQLVFGNAVSFNDVYLSGGVLDEFIDHLDVKIDHDIHSLKISLRPKGSEREIFIEDDNISSLLASAIQPLKLLQSEAAMTNESLQSILSLPDALSNGAIVVGGVLGMEPQPYASLKDFSLKGLTLQAEIPFLSKIAALVNRKVILKIPFAEFRLGTIDLNAERIGASDVYMDGPINLTLNKVDFQLADKDTYLEGKVFGVGFEVVGKVPDLEFYLTEKNSLIKGVTSEDDFEW